MDSELYHHGVLGMKWGHRKGSTHTSSKNKKRNYSKDAETVRELKKKKIYEMSNEDLRTIRNRQELESSYKRLNPNYIKSGALLVGTVAGTMGSIIAIKKNTPEIINIGKDFVNLLTHRHR